MPLTGLVTKLFLFVGLTILITTSTVLPGQSQNSLALSRYRWQKRLLFLFAPTSSDPGLQTLRAELHQSAREVRERDLVVFVILAEGQSYQNGRELSSQDVQTLRQRFGISPRATAVVLVGKDGGVKLQRPGPVALADIFALIDSMPMRQQEKRGQ